MKQFAVYKNKSRNKQAYPYFIDVQADMLAHLNTRLVMPLTQKANSNSQVKALTPVITIEQVDYVILTTMITTTDVKNLKDEDAIINASHLRDQLVAAIDMMILGI
ncbi:CcdB family protein [Xenorhabdus sp. PR6a]|uniref:Toxin CcdB n=1 Tax=Erwinia tracheiphila TaxID=65700 RepID=A0A345CSB6_9GAMM|nr:MULTISPECIES: CcdB family protein [Enterobacterales]AXF76333.1 plasmid maintenance protein CcdB [Erwinia tracheiphila]MDC9582050.1 CcdB family protein [Xenorhabdus sp. PR6a]UIA85005.1 CcdB family protein [Erwinia tracheiphila]UIA93602.1 CcdB family protein [Erwinia tracheiphila]